MIKLKITSRDLGLILMSLYIIMYYNAKNIIIPEIFTSFSLYAFLAWGGCSVCSESYLDEPIKFNKYSSWYLFFMSISLFTMMYSEDGMNVLSGTFYLMIVSFCVTFLILRIVKSERELVLLCWIYGIASFSLVATLFFKGMLIGTASNRLGGDIMGNANTFANMIMAATLYELWLLIYLKNKIKYKILLLVMILSNMFALSLSASRKFFVIPFVFLYILLIMRQGSCVLKRIVKYTLVISVIILAVYYAVFNVPILYEAIGFRFEGLLNGFFGNGIQDFSSRQRDLLRTLAFNGWLQSPVWGFGFNSFKYLGQSELHYFAYSHCNFTELLYNGGMLYFLVYYYICFYILKNAKKNIFIPNRFKAFAVATVISMIVLDYGCVGYEDVVIQTIMAVAVSVVSGTIEEMPTDLEVKTYV